MLNNPLTLFIKYHGCQMNEYDAEKIESILGGYFDIVKTEDINKASIAILVTCAIREKAEHKVYSLLGQWNIVKKKNNMIIAVGGCVASQEGKALQQNCPFVSIVFGPQTLHRLPYLINKYSTSGGKKQIDISFPKIEKFDYIPYERVKKNTVVANLSVMEGCSKFCSYCIVPYTRGEEISRPFDDVMMEAISLEKTGAKEIILLGQNVNDYRYQRSNDSTYIDLAYLIKHIASLKGIKRIRYTTSHPTAFSDHLINLYSVLNKLVKHLHLPVQSGSNRILTLMKRGYTVEEYKYKINKLRSLVPDIPISSDFIVGFPGETKNDFQQTLELIDNIGFDKSFSFIFSPRPGTPAATLKDTLSMEEKKNRLYELQNLLAEYTNKINHKMLGKIYPTLVSAESKNKARFNLSGRTECNRIIHFKGNKTTIMGSIVNIKILEILRTSFIGELVD
jgi:tRNA-2-methylthio-N6-dimethylallyladenosine synthase